MDQTGQIEKSQIILGALVFMMQGQSNGIFDIVPAPEERTQEAYTRLVCERLRFDREENVSDRMGSWANPSKPPELLTISPSAKIKMETYRHLPYDTGQYTILDAFMCFGSRFGIDNVMCYVEVCWSGQYFANVYHTANLAYPAVVITISTAVLHYSQDQIFSELEKALKTDERLAKYAKEAEEAEEK